MNRIILAYAPENANLAESIDRKLSRIGIPFEHANSTIAAQLSSSGEPVLLLVTENFLVNRNCMGGLMPVLQTLATENRLVPVLADGIDANGLAVPTHIDRMANALHYMKYWQDFWLGLSDQHQRAEASEKASLVAELEATREIANEVGDVISILREARYLSWEQFEANDFEAFFQRFNLQDWHGQYKRLAAQALEKQLDETKAQLPQLPIVGGLLTPEPVQSPVLSEPLAPVEIDSQPPQEMETSPDALNEHQEAPTMDAPTAALSSPEMAEQQAVSDAWFWIEKGHVQRGLALLKMAMEHYPESGRLKSEYEKALQLSNPEETETVLAQPNIPLETPQQSTTDEAKSYELMGDMAAERGDYLFAKYCWDRVVEIDPDALNIFRKLGLMTSEHLRDYKETAVIYLQKALETAPEDLELKTALADLLNESPKTPAPLTTESSIPLEVETTPNTEQAAPIRMIPDPVEEQIPEQNPVLIPVVKSPLVLITGATSGIGRATAEIFAKNGYRLILTGRRVDRLVELKNKFEADYGTEILLLPFDVRDPGAVEAALANLPAAFQEIDILVNNAGLAKGLAPIHEGNLEHWETMIDTNVKGLLYVTRLVSPGMVRRRSGHIINVGSSAGKEAYPNGNVYCATKFAVDALTKSMRFDLHAHNIRVSQVSPGHVEETEFAITRFDGDADRAKIYNDFQPLRSSDVAEAIYFMATRPAHVNIQDLQLFATQQASSMVIDRSGR